MEPTDGAGSEVLVIQARTRVSPGMKLSLLLNLVPCRLRIWCHYWGLVE